MDGPVIMSTPVFVLLAALMLASGALVLINMLGGDRSVYDFWSLEDQEDSPPGRLDALRTNAVFYGAVIVFLASFGAYLWLRHA